MKLSDYVIEYITDTLGVRHVFLVVGGANMHLVDSISKNPKIKYISVQHEQAGSMAAEGYSRMTGNIGFELVTSGPGGTNTLTGLCCAWMDSSPVLFISGQVSLHDYTDGKTIRQLGVQQINIIDIVKSVTKYAVLVDDPKTIRFHLEKAIYMAKEGRPGPVWLDIPQNIQLANIEPEKLSGFVPDKQPKISFDLEEKISQTVELLKKAERPVLILGNGIRLAHGEMDLGDLIENLKFPIITTWNAIDLVGSDHPLYVGRSGVFGQYGANFAVANSDLILSIGSRLDTRQTGTRRKSFARSAKKIVVDASIHELQKGLIDIDLPVCMDARSFIAELNRRLIGFKGQNIREWRERCRKWKDQYPVILPEYYKNKKGVNSYVFVEELCDQLKSDDIVVTDMGTSLSCTMQSFKVKKGQRLFTNTGFAPMGYGLPASIGAWFASGNKDRVICLHGDGGLQMNIQEFQTLVHYKVPLKLFILNNREYVTIVHTQVAYFQGRLVGSVPETGYSAPDFVKVAQAYGLPTEKISSHKEMAGKIKSVLKSPGCTVCEIVMQKNQPLIPVLLQHKRSDGSIVTDPIEKLSPYLPEKEFRENMIVTPIED